MTDAEALAEVIGHIQFMATDAEDVLAQVRMTKRDEAIRIAADDAASYRAQLRVLERCRRLLEAEDAPIVERAA